MVHLPGGADLEGEVDGTGIGFQEGEAKAQLDEFALVTPILLL